MLLSQEKAEQIFKDVAFKNKTYQNYADEHNCSKYKIFEEMRKYKKSFGLKTDDKYCAKNYLKWKYKQEIIDFYTKEMWSTVKIAKYYNLKDDHLIATLLRELNIELRPSGKTSKTDQKIFKKIDNELSAYVLGLITADGSISKTYQISITLKESDVNLLQQINEQFLNNSGYLVKESSNKTTYKLSFCGKQICETLKRYNIVPNKTYLLKDILVFDDNNIMRHYLRGLFDGDGVCAYNKPYLRLGYCAYNKEMTKSFQEFLSNKLYLSKNKLFNTGSCWQCSWGKRADVEKIYHYLYDDATIFLSRKKNKIYNYLYGNPEITN